MLQVQGEIEDSYLSHFVDDRLEEVSCKHYISTDDSLIYERGYHTECTPCYGEIRCLYTFGPFSCSVAIFFHSSNSSSPIDE